MFEVLQMLLYVLHDVVRIQTSKLAKTFAQHCMYIAHASHILLLLYYSDLVADQLENVCRHSVQISVLACILANITFCLYDPCCVSYNDCKKKKKSQMSTSVYVFACVLLVLFLDRAWSVVCAHVFDRALCAERMLARRSHPCGHTGQRNLRSGGPWSQQALPYHARSLWGRAVGASCAPH